MDCSRTRRTHGRYFILGIDFLGLAGEIINDVQGFLQYFKNTSMTRARIWNVWALDKNRTDNHMEGWHSHLKDTIKNNLNLWFFIQKIKAKSTLHKKQKKNLMNNKEIIVPLTKKMKKT